MGRDELTCVIFMIVLVRLLPQTLTTSHTQTGVLLLDGLLIIEHNYSNKHYKHTRTSYASVAANVSANTGAAPAAAVANVQVPLQS